MILAFVMGKQSWFSLPLGGMRGLVVPRVCSSDFDNLPLVTGASLFSAGSLVTNGGFWGVVLVVKNLPANAWNARDTGSILDLGRSPGEGHGSPLHCSCLKNPMGEGAWLATVHRVAKSWIQLKQLHIHILWVLVSHAYFSWFLIQRLFVLSEKVVALNYIDALLIR